VSLFQKAAKEIENKIVLITGGTGSFGKRVTRRLLNDFNPSKVIVFSRDEFKQSEMAQKISDPRIRFFIGDVRDRSRLEVAMRDVDIVIHAAALKHVPIAEYNPMECVKTNVDGAQNVVFAALRTKVKKVIALSTDKACNPINPMGRRNSRRKRYLSRRIICPAETARVAAVRYGNVVGSRGSVIPFFKRLLAQNTGHLPITDERMTRFWITLDESVNFVLTGLALMHGGELFVPKIPSMKITDLASTLSSGLPHKIVGIRPGEKLHEVLITEDDSRSCYDIGDRYVILPTERSDVATRYGQGEPVRSDFRYASNTNTQWVDPDELRRMIATLDMDGV
jgi:UDP-N-acetylglucosamine 4,6-dehydratase/5-epimerase